MLLRSVFAHCRSLTAGQGIEPQFSGSEPNGLPLADPAKRFYFTIIFMINQLRYDFCEFLRKGAVICQNIIFMF